MMSLIYQIFKKELISEVESRWWLVGRGNGEMLVKRYMVTVVEGE
jgi:hypothetical protein